jgi:hypothetical protein
MKNIYTLVASQKLLSKSYMHIQNRKPFNQRFFNASNRLIRSSRLGALGIPSAIPPVALGWGFGSGGSLRAGTELGGSLM